jgi:hypothetical protein
VVRLLDAGNCCGPIAVPLHSKGNDLSPNIAQGVAPVAHVVCIVEAGEKKLSVTWSDGTGEFKPYELTGPRLELFRGAARKCRDQLDAMARDYLAWVNAASEADRQAGGAALRKTCFSLAQAGYDVYGRLFRPDDDAPAKKVRKWLEHLRDRGEVESAEALVVNLRPDEAQRRATLFTAAVGGAGTRPPPFTGISPLLGEASQPLPGRFTEQQLVDFLKMPTCQRPAREVIVRQLGQQCGRPFANLWEFVAWAHDHRPDLDLTSPPVRPAKP